MGSEIVESRVWTEEIENWAVRSSEVMECSMVVGIEETMWSEVEVHVTSEGESCPSCSLEDLSWDVYELSTTGM